MATALNMTMKLKQDPASLEKLQGLKQVFASQVQPRLVKILIRPQVPSAESFWVRLKASLWPRTGRRQGLVSVEDGRLTATVD
jgi:hypothetical protein